MYFPRRPSIFTKKSAGYDWFICWILVSTAISIIRIYPGHTNFSHFLLDPAKVAQLFTGSLCKYCMLLLLKQLDKNNTVTYCIQLGFQKFEYVLINSRSCLNSESSGLSSSCLITTVIGLSNHRWKFSLESLSSLQQNLREHRFS